jgi:hypothetical protein
VQLIVVLDFKRLKVNSEKYHERFTILLKFCFCLIATDSQCLDVVSARLICISTYVFRWKFPLHKEQILRLQNLQLQRQRCDRQERFSKLCIFFSKRSRLLVL